MVDGGENICEASWPGVSGIIEKVNRFLLSSVLLANKPFFSFFFFS